MSRSWRDPIEADRLWAVWWGLAVGTGVLASGRWAAPLAAWLSAMFLMRVVRTRRPLPGFLLGIPVLALSFFLPWRGLIPWGGDVGLAIASVAVAVVGMIPYMVDRVLHRQLPGVRATLVFPTLAVTLDLLLTHAGDAGSSFGLVGYTQAGNEPLMQLASLVGIWGISFLIFWSASVANHVWERRFDLAAARVPAGAFAAALAGALLFGGVRLALAPLPEETVRVAMIAEPGLNGPDSFWPSGDVARRYFTGEPVAEDEWAAIGAGTRALHDRLLGRAAAEAGAGARLVTWAEANAPVRVEDEADLLARGAELARAHDAWLAMALLVLPRRAEPGQAENKIVVVDPSGDIVAQYHKAIPVPGFEARMLGPGADRPGVVETPFGRIGLAICYDLDFPRLIRMAAEDSVDILIGPANDWSDVARVHAEMATYRAAELGLSLVRPTSGGISVATDPYGRILAHMDARAGGRSTAVDVPTRGVPTIYATLGDAFAWLCVAGFLLLAFQAIRRGRREGAFGRRPRDAEAPGDASDAAARPGRTPEATRRTASPV